jgi:hypothetical protein
VLAGDHKLIKARSWTAYRGATLAPGDVRLARVVDGTEEPLDDPEVASRLEAIVDAWLGAAGYPPLDDLRA